MSSVHHWTTTTVLQKVIFFTTGWNSTKPGFYDLHVSQATSCRSKLNRTVHQAHSSLSPGHFIQYLLSWQWQIWHVPSSPQDVSLLLSCLLHSRDIFLTTDPGKAFEACGALRQSPRSRNSHRIPPTNNIPHKELSQYCPSHIGNHLPTSLCPPAFHLLNSQPRSGKPLAKSCAWVKHLFLDEPIL